MILNVLKNKAQKQNKIPLTSYLVKPVIEFPESPRPAES